MADLAHQHIAVPQGGRTRRDGGRAGSQGCRGHDRVYDALGRILWDQAGANLAVPLRDDNPTTIRIG